MEDSGAVPVAGLRSIWLRPGKQACAGSEKPTVITVWHAYNAFAKTIFDEKVTEFNETKGLELGIVVDAYGFGSSGELDDALFNSANEIIGSDPLPNVFTAYPDSAYRLDQLAPLVEMEEYYSAEELGRYRAEFLSEGVWGKMAVIN